MRGYLSTLLEWVSGNQGHAQRYAEERGFDIYEERKAEEFTGMQPIAVIWRTGSTAGSNKRLLLWKIDQVLIIFEY